MIDDPRDATSDPDLDSAISDTEARTASGDPIPAPPDAHDPDGREPMTGPQHTHLQALSEEAGERFDDSLSAKAAAQRIEELEDRLPGRGQD
ncbi:MAG: DUF3072 domain-containing protein [Solirubrobacterales bacterium]